MNIWKNLEILNPRKFVQVQYDHHSNVSFSFLFSKVDFDNLEAETQAEHRRRSEREARQRALLEQRVTETLAEMRGQ